MNNNNDIKKEKSKSIDSLNDLSDTDREMISMLLSFKNTKTLNNNNNNNSNNNYNDPRPLIKLLSQLNDELSVRLDKIVKSKQVLSNSLQIIINDLIKERNGMCYVFSRLIYNIPT